MISILSAPLQGLTFRAYRLAHAKLAGGVEAYLSPFLRLEHGEPRKKELHDVSPLQEKLIPQIIASDANEMGILCDALQQIGYSRIDINLGCPFPMQVHACRGSGMLHDLEKVEALLKEVTKRDECTFSIKMRLGWDNADEAQRLLPLLNVCKISSITLHPRIGRQQYKGIPNLDAFARFAKECTKPLYYNGDVVTKEDAESIINRFSNLSGLMIGRGLLRNPLLAREINGEKFTNEERRKAFRLIHDEVYHFAVNNFYGDAQILSHLQPFWDYYDKGLFDSNAVKRLTKCCSLRDYNAALRSI